MPRYLALVLLCGVASTAEAQHRYPLVYGPAGRPYGPTQAHYQYLRQYGRPWHGYGGLVAPSGVGSGPFTVSGGYLPVWGGYGAPFYAPPVTVVAPGYYGYFGPSYPAPVFTAPVYVNPVAAPVPLAWSAPVMTDPLAAVLQQHQQHWGHQLPAAKPDPIARPVVPSSTDARLRSLEAQSKGDRDMREQKWLQAYIDYKKAVQLASDRADAHLRLGLALIALQHYDSAATSLKRAVSLNPGVAQSELTLETLFGPGSELARSSVTHKLIDYVNDDIRDPDRLFLLGVLLHIDHDADRAAQLFETAARLGGMKQHLHAFLTEPPVTEPAGVPIENDPDAPHEPPPPPAPAIDETQPTVPTEPQAVPPATTPPLPRTSGPRLPRPNPILPTPLPTASR